MRGLLLVPKPGLPGRILPEFAKHLIGWQEFESLEDIRGLLFAGFLMRGVLDSNGSRVRPDLRILRAGVFFLWKVYLGGINPEGISFETRMRFA